MEIAVAYNEFHQSLLSYVRSKIRSKEDAEDILQNVFTKISTKTDSLSEKDKVQNWLFTITKNAVIDYYRARSKKMTFQLDDVLTEQLREEEVTDGSEGLENCVSIMVNLLPSEYRDIIEDAELHGVKQKDLAVKYDMPYSSMRSRAQRGREKLKELFHNCCVPKTNTVGNVLQTVSGPNCEGSCSPNNLNC
jgi:RNA polymerase sigma-70 factor (ECF subfamily)